MLNSMTLEDFFTLTEMKDGLSVPTRVEELVAVMKKEKDCVARNVGDAMRQWSTVISVIAVTDNKECLDRFFQLEGLVFIDSWLKDAQNTSAEADVCLLEESILALLQVLKKQEIENDKSNSSGIYLTVRDLLSHKSINITDNAKVLLRNSEPASASGAAKLQPEVAQTVCDDRMEPENRVSVESDAPVSSSTDRPDQKFDADRHIPRLNGDYVASCGCEVDKQSVGADAVEKVSDKLGSYGSASDLKELKDIIESSVVGEECSSDEKAMSTSPDREKGSDVSKNVTRLTSVPKALNADIHNGCLPNKLRKVGVCSASFMPKHVQDETCVLEIDRKDGRVANIHVDSSTPNSISANRPMDGTSSQSDDQGILMNCTTTLTEITPSEDDTSCSNTSHGSSGDVHMLTKSQDSSGFDPSRVCETVVSLKKTSAMDLEYGMFDALEVACLVAKEVERQVVEDFDEDFGSFSRKSSRASALPIAGSPPASIYCKIDQHADGKPVHELPAGNRHVEDASVDDKPSTNSENRDAEQKDDMTTDPPEVSNMAPDATSSAEKGTSTIDLNLEMCSEAADDIGYNVSNLVSVVSASRAVAAPGLLASALKFEGSLGWKGSAATSAFRPASPRRTSNPDKTVLVQEATDASRLGRSFVFDLNLAEDCAAAPSGESMFEPSPRKSENLGFDLNLLSDDMDAPFTPSLKPGERNFDLNDRLFNFSDPPSDLHPYLGASSSYQQNDYGGAPDDSIISIMGAKVKRNSFIHDTPVTFFNGGRASQPMVDANLSRSGPHGSAVGAFHYTPIYNYNDIAVGSALPFSPPMFRPSGSASYLVDSRGIPMMPQQMGAPPTTFQAPFAHQPSFTSNMMAPFQGLDIASSSRSQLNFNPGFVIEGVNRVDNGSFRQFVPGQGRSADLQLQLQPLFPGIVGGKRKEPDGGWERHRPPYL